MNDIFGDARFEELQLLSEIGRRGHIMFDVPMSRPIRDMITFLILENLVSEPGIHWSHNEDHRFTGLPGESEQDEPWSDGTRKCLQT